MNASTNFATGTAQGAAVAHTYNVGAIFNLNTENETIGVVVSQLHQDHYGVVLLTTQPSYSNRYRYSVRHSSELDISGVMPVENQMKLKIASMIFRNPLLDKNFEIINETDGGLSYVHR